MVDPSVSLVVEEPCVVKECEFYQNSDESYNYLSGEHATKAWASQESSSKCTRESSKDASFRDKFGSFFFKIAGADEEVNAYELRALMVMIFKNDFAKAEDFSIEACRSLVAMMDEDRSGALRFHEFEKLWSLLMEWKRCFEICDRDKSRTIDRLELHAAMTRLGYKLSDRTVSILSARYVNKKGSINLDDFIQLCAKVRTATNLYEKFHNRVLNLEDYIMSSVYI